MSSDRLLIVAMAQHCRTLLMKADTPTPGLAAGLQPRHLMWMCDQIEKHAEHSTNITKLHRWIGFVQAGILANQLTDLDGLRTMFDDIKKLHRLGKDNSDDLIDHLDPSNPFELDLGGQG